MPCRLFQTEYVQNRLCGKSVLSPYRTRPSDSRSCRSTRPANRRKATTCLQRRTGRKVAIETNSPAPEGLTSTTFWTSAIRRVHEGRIGINRLSRENRKSRGPKALRGMAQGRSGPLRSGRFHFVDPIAMEARFGVMLFDCGPVRRVEDAVDLVLTFIEEDVVMGHSELIGGRGLQFLQYVCGQGVHPMAVDEFRRLVHLLLRRGCWVFRSRPRSALVQRGMHKTFFKLSPGSGPWVIGLDDPASHGRSVRKPRWLTESKPSWDPSVGEGTSS